MNAKPMPTLQDAERYVGLPYVAGEFDCADLVVRVQRELFGRELAVPADRPRPGGARGQAREIGRWREALALRTDLAETGCAVLMTEPAEHGETWHLGTVFMQPAYLGEVWVLHASATLGGVALQRLRDLQRWGLRLEGFYLWK